MKRLFAGFSPVNGQSSPPSAPKLLSEGGSSKFPIRRTRLILGFDSLVCIWICISGEPNSMSTRREFLKSAALFGVAGAAGASVTDVVAQTVETKPAVSVPTKTGSDRAYWLDVMQRIASPVLENLSQRQLKQRMPVEAANPADDRLELIAENVAEGDDDRHRNRRAREVIKKESARRHAHRAR